MTDEAREPWMDAMKDECQAYIEDRGFTDRVLTTLPPRRRTGRWWRPFILLAAATLAAGLCLLLVPALLPALLPALTTPSLTNPVTLIGLAAVLALAGSAFVLATAD